MTDETPRRLPTIRYNGKEYFIDWRLKEFRSVEAPLEFIPFDSELGREIDKMQGPEKDMQSTEKNITVTCTKCRKVLFEGTESERRHLILYCQDCPV